MTQQDAGGRDADSRVIALEHRPAGAIFPELFHNDIFRSSPPVVAEAATTDGQTALAIEQQAMRDAASHLTNVVARVRENSNFSRRAFLPFVASALAGAAILRASATQAASPEQLKDLIRTHLRAAHVLRQAGTREDETPEHAPNRTEIEREYTAANDAEEDAITAVCGYVCRQEGDGLLKARYLRRYFDRMVGPQSWHVDALLQSIAGGADV
jgi:hypothetical protein